MPRQLDEVASGVPRRDPVVFHRPAGRPRDHDRVGLEGEVDGVAVGAAGVGGAGVPASAVAVEDCRRGNTLAGVLDRVAGVLLGDFHVGGTSLASEHARFPIGSSRHTAAWAPIPTVSELF